MCYIFVKFTKVLTILKRFKHKWNWNINWYNLGPVKQENIPASESTLCILLLKIIILL